MKTQEQNERTVNRFMVNHVEAQLLRYAAGQNIFCPRCQDIMDWRRTVIVTIYATKPNDGREAIVKQYVQCDKCWELARKAFHAGVEQAIARQPAAGIRSEIVDGRESRFDAVDA